jgi:hypothetical protein
VPLAFTEGQFFYWSFVFRKHRKVGEGGRVKYVFLDQCNVYELMVNCLYKLLRSIISHQIIVILNFMKI